MQLNKNIEPNNAINNDDDVIVIKKMAKSFGTNEVLKDVTLSVKKGENLVLLGKSGSGKSIIIKCIVGLVDIDAGQICVLKKDIVTLKNKELNDVRLKIGFLFQGGALYDSMTVEENLLFALKRNKKSLKNTSLNEEVIEALNAVGLKDAIHKMPSELSGGMRKRVALARTLILNPAIMLYDEPTTGLDTITSKEISELILKIQKEYKTTSIIITHDMACAKLTANTIAILKDGVIYVQGSYDELENSKDEWVKSFFI